jgi:alpha-maltose-1-phosphate synthase
MQTYEKMLGRIDLEAFALTINRFALDLIKVPTNQILSIDEPFARLSSKLGFYFNLFLQATCGLDYLHLGLVKKLKGFDIVHTMETFNAFSYQGLEAKRRYGSKLVVTVWENRPYAAERFRRKREMKYEVLREADLLIPMTKRAGDCLILEGADPEKVWVQPVGIDMEQFKPGSDDGGLREKLGIGADEIVIVSVAALLWEKGVYDLIHAFKRIKNDPLTAGRKVRLIMAGSGPEKKQLEELVTRIGLDGDVMIRRFPYDDVPNVYRAADIFVLASTARRGWLEQFGYVLPEAMASGLPVVAAQSGSIPEVVGEGGVIVPPSDFMGLADALLPLIAEKGIREEMGRKARAEAERLYDSKKNAKKLEEAYMRLLEEDKR